MKLAIHQPNFIPWLGFFHRLSLVDTFVFLNHVQNNNGKSWVSRNKLIISGHEKWVTIPTRKKGNSFQRINAVEINYDTKEISKLIKSIELSYKKCTHFSDVFQVLFNLLSKEYKYIADFNQEFIIQICKKLNFQIKFLDSNQILTDSQKLKGGNDLVLEIAKRTKCGTYVSGKGCLDFINPSSFSDEGIEFQYHEFNHPNYQQLTSKLCTSHLSILDALFNLGFEGTCKLILNA